MTRRLTLLATLAAVAAPLPAAAQAAPGLVSATADLIPLASRVTKQTVQRTVYVHPRGDSAMADKLTAAAFRKASREAQPSEAEAVAFDIPEPEGLNPSEEVKVKGLRIAYARRF